MNEIEQQNSPVEETVSDYPNTDELNVIAALGTQPLPLNNHTGEILEAVIAGHICLEITPELVEDGTSIVPGQVLEAGRAALSIGGPASNIGLSLHTLGIPTRLMGKVGNDLFGQAIFQMLSSYGNSLTRGMVIAVDEASSYSIRLPSPGAKPIIIHAPGCNANFSAEDVPYEMLESTGLFHFGYPALMTHLYEEHGKELAAIFQRVKALSVTTSLDLSSSDLTRRTGEIDWSQILETTLPSVDIFLADIEELLLQLRRPLYDKLSAKSTRVKLVDRVEPGIVSELGQQLLAMGAKIVGIKLGQRGIYLVSAGIEKLTYMGRAQPIKLVPWGSRELWAPCFVGKAVNEIGVGDATTAGFLMGILRGMGPEATLAVACAAGASSAEGEDALSGLRGWPETMERIAAGWPRLLPEKKEKKQTPALNMSSYKWRWDENHELWSSPHDQAL